MWKVAPEEKVGVLALRANRPCIIEYSEMGAAMTAATDPQGRLLYGAANICNHFYTLQFLQQVAVPALASGGSVAWHIARKQVRLVW